MVKCNLCKQDVENYVLSEHQNECPFRLIPCEYCELDCSASNIESHQLACGSRTELCDVCNNFVLVHVLKAHIELHNNKKLVDIEKIPFETLPFPHLANNALTDFNDSIENQNNGFQMAALQHGLMIDEQDDTVYIPCEFCQENFPLFALEEHQALCGTTIEKCDHCQCSFERNQRSFHVCQPGLQGKNALQSDDDDEYWSKYGATPKNIESIRDSPPLLLSADEEERYWSKYPTSNYQHNEIEDDDPSILCEICRRPFPFSCFQTHQIACQFATSLDEVENPTIVAQSFDQRFLISCSFCNISIVADSLEMHEAECSRIMKQKKQLIEPRIKKPEPVNVVCSICNVVISSDLFELHEARCARWSKEVKSSVKLVTSVPKPPRENKRLETPSQRAQREAILAAAKIRQEKNPIIPQSKMVVVQLVSGDQILKKRHNDDDSVDIGERLGHGFGLHDYSIDKVKQPEVMSPLKKIDQRTPTDSVIGSVKSTLFKSASFDHHGIHKKSNSAFKKNAYEPDIGHKLGSNGRFSNRLPSRENRNVYFENQSHQYDARQAREMDKELGARPKQPMKPRELVHNYLDVLNEGAVRVTNNQSGVSDIRRKLTTNTNSGNLSQEPNGKGSNKKTDVAFKYNFNERNDRLGTNEKN